MCDLIFWGFGLLVGVNWFKLLVVVLIMVFVLVCLLMLVCGLNVLVLGEVVVGYVGICV